MRLSKHLGRFVVLTRRFSNKFSPIVDRNDISALTQVKKEAKEKLQSEKQEIENQMLTTDQLTQKIIQVSNLEDLKVKVVERKRPTVMFCMAKWCNTSKQLLPTVLEQYSLYWQSWDLALIDIDEDAKLTSALKIDKVPTVLLIAHGDVVDGFKGIVSETEVQNFFNTAKKVGDSYAAASDIEEAMSAMVKAYEAQEWMKVLEYTALLKQAPLHPTMKRLARLFEVSALVSTGLTAEAKALYDEITAQPMPKGQEQVLQSISAIESGLSNYFEQYSLSQTQATEGLSNSLEAAGNDQQRLYTLALASIEEEAFEIALESLIRILKIDRNWNEKAAFNKFLETLKNPKVPKGLVKTYRLKLGSIVA